MTARWRRASAFSTDSELSMAQADELLVKTQVSLAVKLNDKDHLSTQAEQLCGWTKKRRIWIVYLIGFMDLFGVSMMIPFIPRLAQQAGASPTMTGLLGSLYGALQVFSSPVMGKLSDVYGRKSILLLAYLGPCVGYFVLGTADSVLLLFLSRIPPGVLKHGLSVCKAYLTDITDNNDRRSVLGLFNAISSFGFIFGPLISGYLADVDPTLKLSIYLGATVFGLNVLLVLLLLPPSNPATDKMDASTNELSISLKSLYKALNVFKGLHVWELLDILFVRFLLTFAVIMYRTNFPVLLDKHFHADGTTLGKILSFNGIIAAISAASCGYISSFYSSQIKQITHFTLLLAASLTCATLSHDIFFLVLCLVPMALSTSNLRICMLSLMLQRGREDEKGAIIGVGSALASISRMLAPAVVGIAQEYGSEVSGYVSAGLTVLALLVLMLYPIKPKEQHVETQR